MLRVRAITEVDAAVVTVQLVGREQLRIYMSAPRTFRTRLVLAVAHRSTIHRRILYSLAQVEFIPTPSQTRAATYE